MTKSKKDTLLGGRTEKIPTSTETFTNRLEHDENMLLKVLSELGDIARYHRYLEAQIIKLKKRVTKLEGN